MINRELTKYTLKNIAQRKTRSILTIASIFFGIATIFIFVSFGLGLYSYVNSFTTDSTANKITVMPKGIGVPGLDDTFAITKEDLEAIRKSQGVYQVTGMYTKSAEVKHNQQTKYVFAAGYDPANPLVLEISNMEIYKGSELRPGESGKVILGYNYQIDNKIFTRGLEINDVITIQGKNARVVGFFSQVGNPQDDSNVYVTNEYFEELYPESKLKYAMAIAVVDTSDIDNVVENVEENLRRERNLDKGKEDFFVASFEDLLETYTSSLNIIIAFIVLIALVSVMVSAINTANTMITSVLERIKEIGVIKSIGARNSEIFQIFLLESGILGFIAGVLGVLIGFILSFIGGQILTELGWSFLQPVFPWQLFVGAIVFATVTGAISGAYPAWRASKVKPVDALRYE